MIVVIPFAKIARDWAVSPEFRYGIAEKVRPAPVLLSLARRSCLRISPPARLVRSHAKRRDSHNEVSPMKRSFLPLRGTASEDRYVPAASLLGSQHRLPRCRSDCLTKHDGHFSCRMSGSHGRGGRHRRSVTVYRAGFRRDRFNQGRATIVTLTAYDANGNQEAAGGSTVVFSVGSGSAQGVFSAVTDNGDGTYTATFTGTSADSQHRSRRALTAPHSRRRRRASR